MFNEKEAWQELRERLRSDLHPLMTAAGLQPGMNGRDFVSEGVDVELRSGSGAWRWETVCVKVKPPFRVGNRPSIYRLKVRDVTPQQVGDVVQKAVAKVREFQEANTRAKAREVETARRQVAAERLINGFMRERFPEFKNSYDNMFDLRDGDMDVRLEARVEGETVSFRLKLDEYLTAEEAREVVNFMKRLEAARNTQAARA